MRVRLRHGALSAVSIAQLFAATAFAGVDEIVQAIANSDIEFALAESNVPFIPVAWAKYRHYAESEFLSQTGGQQLGAFQEEQASLGLLVPIYVAKRDMIVAGIDASFSQFDFTSTGIPDADVATITPAAGWLRQLDEDSQVAAFIAPLVSSAFNDTGEWGVDAFAGLIGSYRASDRVMWVYGGVYEYSFGTHYVYPYVGLRWLPNKQWAISLIAPWPTVAYAPTPDFFVSIGVEPGGASWRIKNGGEETVASFGSWNLGASAGYRLGGRLWLRAELGVAGLRSLEFADNGTTKLEADIDSDPVATLSLEFRP